MSAGVRVRVSMCRDVDCIWEIKSEIRVVLSIISHTPLRGSGPFNLLHPRQLIGCDTFLTDP